MENIIKDLHYAHSVNEITDLSKQIENCINKINEDTISGEDSILDEHLALCKVFDGCNISVDVYQNVSMGYICVSLYYEDLGGQVYDTEGEKSFKYEGMSVEQVKKLTEETIENIITKDLGTFLMYCHGVYV